jgi:MFS family permease
MGRYIGAYSTMVGMTFVIGPSLLAWAGTDSRTALWLVVALLAAGLAWTALIPVQPTDHDSHSARVGLRGLWHAVLAHPVIMLAGFVGGFFELGLASILPLYGLTLGMGASAAALLVSVSGLGGTLLAIPSGMLADRFASPAQGRMQMMRIFTGLILLTTLASPFAVSQPTLVWPLVCIWGAAGGALYTLSMTDIGANNKGLTLLNSTAVLVLTYTLGGLSASAACGALIDHSVGIGFPALLVGVASIGLLALLKARRGSQAVV